MMSIAVGKSKYANNAAVQKVVEIQSKPRTQKQRTFFCRLCRNYGIKERKAHLKNYHNTDHDTISKKATNDIVDIIFVDSTVE